MSEKTILVIDDDIDLVEIIRVTLENEGYKVVDAQSGLEYMGSLLIASLAGILLAYRRS